MIIIAASEVSNSIWIHLLKLKWMSNKALINLTLNTSKIFFMILINTKDDFYSFFLHSWLTHAKVW